MLDQIVRRPPAGNAAGFQPLLDGFAQHRLLRAAFFWSLLSFWSLSSKCSLIFTQSTISVDKCSYAPHDGICTCTFKRHFPHPVPSSPPQKFPGYSGLFRRPRFSSPLPGAHQIPPEQIPVPNMPIPRKIRSESACGALHPRSRSPLSMYARQTPSRKPSLVSNPSSTPLPRARRKFPHLTHLPRGALNQARAVSPDPQSQSN
jgi:hypothetical protein